MNKPPAPRVIYSSIHLVVQLLEALSQAACAPRYRCSSELEAAATRLLAIASLASPIPTATTEAAPGPAPDAAPETLPAATPEARPQAGPDTAAEVASEGASDAAMAGVPATAQSEAAADGGPDAAMHPLPEVEAAPGADTGPGAAVAQQEEHIRRGAALLRGLFAPRYKPAATFDDMDEVPPCLCRSAMSLQGHGDRSVFQQPAAATLVGCSPEKAAIQWAASPAQRIFTTRSACA